MTKYTPEMIDKVRDSYMLYDTSVFQIIKQLQDETAELKNRISEALRILNDSNDDPICNLERITNLQDILTQNNKSMGKFVKIDIN